MLIYRFEMNELLECFIAVCVLLNKIDRVQNRLYLINSMSLCRNYAKFLQSICKVFLHAFGICKLSDTTFKYVSDLTTCSTTAIVCFKIGMVSCLTTSGTACRTFLFGF